ncbi:MAG TPA: hypothetical protein VKF60_02520 [Myxococcota bacterium]|nr:hypothetical protein [Myxococcota bacterium]
MKRRRLALWLGLPLASLCAFVWLAPALLLRFALPLLAASSGGAVEVTGAFPALPFGVRATHLRVARDGRELELDDLRAVLLPSGPRLDARVADGTLLVRGEGVLARRGFVRVQDVDLESLATVLAAPLGLRGRADGIWHFGPDASLEGSVSRGALVVQRPAQFEVAFAQLVISAERDPEGGDWKVRWLDVQGPPLSGSASGTLAANGQIAFQAQVRQLEEPVRSFFALLKLPTEPLPLELSLGGTLAAPQVQRVGTPPTRSNVTRGATPPPATR